MEICETLHKDGEHYLGRILHDNASMTVVVLAKFVSHIVSCRMYSTFYSVYCIYEFSGTIERIAIIVFTRSSWTLTKKWQSGSLS